MRRTHAAALVLALAGSTAALGPTPAVVAASHPAAVPAGLLTAAGAQCDPEVPLLIDARPAVLDRLDLERAWGHATGRGVTVAVVDSGVDVRNPHLTSVVVDGTDLVSVDGDPQGRTDTAGHGTAVAGQIAARPVDGSGVVGVAPEADVLAVRAYVEDTDRGRSEGTAPSTARMAAGIRWAAERGATVINVSLSSPVDDPELRAAVDAAALHGALVVASAGNRTTAQDTSDSPRYPAAYPGVLGVAAVGPGDAPTDASIHGPHVDVAAPGTDVLTTFHSSGDCVLGGETPSASFATAYVAASAALVAEAFPAETPEQWAHRLMVTASRPQAGERDDAVGWGVVRPADALTFVDDGSAPGPASPLHGPPAPAEEAAEPVRLSSREDVLGAAQEGASWWLLAAGGAVVGAVLVAQLRPARRRRTR
ncbi:type VII secretion-associated serine protease mycosin [Cellulomonas sp. APG4]|uniref:type VII secretion-associated serine protease mycosin n=1 Tax=Cellulomonas sp. APG4 TaxID=1538656 RepID=UPI00137B1290|nr:type VII secretion-associated serine protease mycosin [Cellulomonas sp. APG4]